MKKLSLLAFVLIGTMSIANAQTETEITITYQDINGEEYTIIGQGDIGDMPCCGETVVYGGGNVEPQGDWVHIPIFWESDKGSGRYDWFGPGDETVGESGLYDFLMNLLDNM